MHDLRARELQVEEIVNPNADVTNPLDILIKFGIAKYNQSNNFLDSANNPLDPLFIPDLGTIVYLMGLSSGVKTLPFTQSDLLDLGGGNWYLQITLTANELVLAVSSTASGTKDQTGFTMVDGKIFGFANDDGSGNPINQNIIVKIG